MHVNPECRDGDVVLVRASIQGQYHPLVRVGHYDLRPESVEIVTIEKANFQIGDWVAADADFNRTILKGRILALTAAAAWVQADTVGSPLTVPLGKLRRLPAFPTPSANETAAPPSGDQAAEITSAPERLVPRMPDEAPPDLIASDEMPF